MVLLVLAITTVTILFAAPGEALAWGPIAHLAHGASVLAQLDVLTPALRQLLRSHPDTFLYGCVGADIIQAKRFTRDLRSHCHSWSVAWQLLRESSTPAERAFAYGYLTHLAADTASHNYFVPLQLIVSFRATALKHVYWEARFDAMYPEGDWTRLRAVLSAPYPACDDLMERVIERTLFSFRTNKRIFSSVMALHGVDQWRTLMHRVGARSRYALTDKEAARYSMLCSDNALELLHRGEAARCVALDPTGKENLARAEQIRKRLRALHRRRQLTPALQHDIMARIVPELRAAIG